MSYLHDVVSRVQARFGRYRREIVSGREIGKSIEIERLICPLRYDLRVRIDFIRLLRDDWPLYTEDLQGFLERPESRAYFTWFKEVACARYMPELHRNEELLKPAFINRVQETAKLWALIERHGYDPSTPIRLKSGRSIRAVNGKTIDSIYFAGDGCHRMSCLYLRGQTRLDPEQYEVEIHPEFQPLDNTALLIKHLPLDRSTYLRFISRFYCGGATLESADQIREHVAAERPQLLPELTSVFAFDLARV